MKAKTLEALQASIKHWEENAAATAMHDIVISRKTCALCNLFNTDEMSDEDSCVGCPVYKATGQKFCKGTPYIQANTADVFEDFDDCKAACQKEVEFLRSLLPKQKKTGGAQ